MTRTHLFHSRMLFTIALLVTGCSTQPADTTNSDLQDDYRWSAQERETSGLSEPWLEESGSARTGDCTTGSNGDYNYCSADCPCEVGEGDCDSDDQCDAGLMCRSDVGSSYGMAWYVDVCITDCRPSSTNGAPNHCRASCPCESGHGDCDSMDECMSGLDCINNDGTAYGLPWYTDVCEPTCHDGAPGKYNRCSTTCPCESGDGDCDSDSECASGLTCGVNNGASYGFNWYVDVCE